MHLFKSQLLQEAARRGFGPYREQGFALRYARRRTTRLPTNDGCIAASNDDFAAEDVGTIEAAREILRRMADYDQAA
jgi:hypothetical protein